MCGLGLCPKRTMWAASGHAISRVLTSMHMNWAGCYENYLNVPYRDADMLKTSELLEWVGFYDSLNTALIRTQNFSTMAYMQYPIMGVCVCVCVKR